MIALFNNLKFGELKNIISKIHLFSPFGACSALAGGWGGFFLLLVFLPLLGQGGLYAQPNYPVQVATNLVPPYSLYLDDYASGFAERIRVTLVNRDMQYPSMNVRLRLTIKGNGFTLTTNSYATIPPVTIEPNMPYRLTADELAPYFATQNLTASGMGSSAWQRERKLPEGMLEFCFEAVEHLTGRVLSLPGCGNAWIVTQKPPLLSLPFNAENATYRDPLNLLFQWTPQHSGLANVEYEFIIKQLFDNGLKPEAAWAYSPEVLRERVRGTSVLYGAALPPLTPGMRYAWAVRAIATEGIDEVRVFENNGLSEVRWFSLADYCPPPLSVTANAERGRMALEWTPLPEHLDYTVSYRRKDMEGAEWFYTPTALPRLTIYDIRPGYTYEFRIGAACTPGNPVYGEVRSIYVPVPDTLDPDCGKMRPIDLSNRTPLPALAPGQQFMAADFPVYVTQVSGANGTFTGEGYTIMPAMFAKAKLRVRWSNITLNTDYRMVAGEINGVYDEANSQVTDLDDIFEGGSKVGNVKSGITKADVDLSFTIPDDALFTFNPDNGIVTVTDGQGNNVGTFTVPEKDDLSGNTGGSVFPMTVTDKEGNTYLVEEAPSESPNEDGTVTLTTTKIGSKGTLPPADALKTIATEKGTVRFKAHPEQTYAFDEYQSIYGKSSLIGGRYESLNNGTYRVNAKAMAQGKTDVVIAEVEVKDKTVLPDSIQFITGKGTRFRSKPIGNNRYEVTVIGGEGGDAQELYAAYGKHSLGKLLIATYTPQNRKVVIVPVGSATVDKQTIQNGLNEIYQPLCVNWMVEVAAPYTDNAWDLNGDGKLKVSGSNFFANQTDEMKALSNGYAASLGGQYDNKAAYLFAFAGHAADSTVQGDMPRGKQFGYLFGSVDGALVAHELGHGIFTLKHPFDGLGYKQGELTGNLMDYPIGKHMVKFQWDVMHDPGVVVGVFERDEDAAAFRQPGTHFLCIQDEEALNKINTYQYFYLPDGRIVNLKGYQASGFFTSQDLTPGAPGSVAAIRNNGKDFLHRFKANTTTTTGYESIDINKLLVNTTEAKASAIRVFINQTANTIKIEKNGKTIESIDIKIKCECLNTTTSSAGFLAKFAGKEDKFYYSLVQEVAKLLDEMSDTYWNEYRKNSVEINLNYLLYNPDEKHTESLIANSLRGMKLYLERTKSNHALLMDADNADDVYFTCVYFNNGDYLALSVDQRISALKKLASEYMGDAREQIALKLISTVEEKDKATFLEKLVTKKNQDGTSLITLLNSRIDDDYTLGFFGLDRYKDLMTILTNLTIKNVSDASIENLLSNYQNRLLYWNLPDEQGDKGLLKTEGTLTADGSIKIDRYAGEPYSRVVAPDGASIKGIDWKKIGNSYSLNPFESVLFVNSSQLPAVNEMLSSNTTQFQVPGGKAYLVPAIVLEYARQKNINKNIEQGVMIALDAASIAATGGTMAFAKSISWGRKLWLAFDVARTTGNIFLTLNYDQISDPSLKKAADWYMRIDMMLSLGDLGYSAYKAANNSAELRKAFDQSKAEIDNARKTKAANVDELENAFKKQAEEAGFDWEKLSDVITSYAGKATKGGKNLIEMESPAGLFRQLVSNGKTYRAATFWNETAEDIVHYLSADAKYYIKHHPTTGRMLFIDVENGKFMGFAVDETGLLKNIGDNYEPFLSKLKTIHGLPGGATNITLKNGERVILSQEKANIIFGSYNPKAAGVLNEISTADVIEELQILKNYSFADKSFELRKGSVHVLNIPQDMGNTSTDFFDAFNKDYCDLVIQNKDAVQAIYVTKPQKELLYRYLNSKVIINTNGRYDPSGFAKEIKYLRENGVSKIKLKDGSIFDLSNIDLDNINLDWSSWNY